MMGRRGTAPNRERHCGPYNSSSLARRYGRSAARGSLEADKSKSLIWRAGRFALLIGLTKFELREWWRPNELWQMPTRTPESDGVD